MLRGLDVESVEGNEGLEMESIFWHVDYSLEDARGIVSPWRVQFHKLPRKVGVVNEGVVGRRCSACMEVDVGAEHGAVEGFAHGTQEDLCFMRLALHGEIELESKILERLEETPEQVPVDGESGTKPRRSVAFFCVELPMQRHE